MIMITTATNTMIASHKHIKQREAGDKTACCMIPFILGTKTEKINLSRQKSEYKLPMWWASCC